MFIATGEDKTRALFGGRNLLEDTFNLAAAPPNSAGMHKGLEAINIAPPSRVKTNPAVQINFKSITEARTFAGGALLHVHCGCAA